MIDTKALREKILDLAIRGKLVPQDPNDEPASILLERIRAEKQQMVKDGKLKPKDIKNDTIIFKGEDNLHYEKFQDGTVKCIEDEIPFDVPSSWCWARLGVIFLHNTGKALNSSNQKGNPYTYITTSNLYWEHFVLDNLKQMYFTDDELEKCTVKKGDLLVCEGGDIGRSAIWESDNNIRIQNHIHRLRYVLNVSVQFYYFVMYFYKYTGRINGNGIGMQGLSSNRLHSILVPLPPVNEQVKIAKRIDNCFNTISIIECEFKNTEEIISSVKSKILDLAIRGKLVSQDPNDEPVSVLLERIKAEKEELIKQGKIKRDKKGSVIFKGNDNSYYQDLPKNWAITTLRDITSNITLNDGDWILSDNMDANGTVKLIQLGSVGFMKYLDKGFKYITENTFQKLSCTQINPAYMLINRIISDKMCACILPDIEGKLITTVDTCWISPNNNYNIKYLLYALSSPVFQSIVMMNTAGTTRKRISKNNLISLPLPFPPIAEQEKIVKMVEKYFTIINSITDAIL